MFDLYAYLKLLKKKKNFLQSSNQENTNRN